MNYRKLLSIILTIILIFSLSACSGNDTADVSRIPIVSGAYTPGTTLDELEEALKNENSTTTSSKESTSTSSKKSSGNSSKKTNTTTSAKTYSKDTTAIKVPAPKLYKVTNDKGNVVWLFGSIHVGEKSFYPLPDYVMNAFNSSDVLAVEFDLVAFENDVAAQTNAMTQMVSPNGSIKNHLTDYNSLSLYNEAVEILSENNMYNALMDYYKPALWSMLIDNATYQKIGANAEYGVDRHLLNKAKQKKMKIENIESAESQYKMLADFSDELQTTLLKKSIEGYKDSNAKKELETLISLWKIGDYTQLGEIFGTDFRDVMLTDFEVYKEYYTAMYTDRELVMCDYIENALSSGKETFACIGAAHLARPMGIIERLKVFKRFTVEEVN